MKKQIMEQWIRNSESNQCFKWAQKDWKDHLFCNISVWYKWDFFVWLIVYAGYVPVLSSCKSND